MRRNFSKKKSSSSHLRRFKSSSNNNYQNDSSGCVPGYLIMYAAMNKNKFKRKKK